MPVKQTQSGFIENATKFHGGKYDYSKVKYINSSTKVKIICPIHGEFEQTPNSHLSNGGCAKCGIERRVKNNASSTFDFIEKSNKIHKNKYSYDKVIYKNSRTKVVIHCPEHGDFLQTPHSHLRGNGCNLCRHENSRAIHLKDKLWFIDRANTVHNGFYIYDKVVYTRAHLKVCIICPIHGEFEQTPVTHMKGCGCPKCGVESKYVVEGDMQDFLNRSYQKHGNLYDYSKVKLIRFRDKVEVICPKHGSFWVTPNIHLSKTHRGGCPKCRMSLGELHIYNYLLRNNMNFIQEYTEHGCCAKIKLSFDFAVFSDAECTDLIVLIEFDGEQHFTAIRAFGGIEKLKWTQEHDRIKNNFCLTNNIKLIRIPYTEMENINSILDRELKIEN